MILSLGIDSFDVLVIVEDIPPGIYKNQALLSGFPLSIGPIRFSDDPGTPENDSTEVKILGVESDTLYVRKMICKGVPLELDGSPYGIDYLWDNGSTGAQLIVTAAGEYELVLFDGCESNHVVFQVEEGESIEIFSELSPIDLMLGETVILDPEVYTTADTIIFVWEDPLDHSLSCLECQAPEATPNTDATYIVRVSNGTCSDSAVIVVRVDHSRKIYAPNIFSPNNDGINDFFFLRSPDFGIVKSLVIFNRWGNTIWHSSDVILNDEQTGWNGMDKGNRINTGVYLWRAEIEFLDGLQEVFMGDIAIVK
jgi:gliding motility-associated-like protein